MRNDANEKLGARARMRRFTSCVPARVLFAVNSLYANEFDGATTAKIRHDGISGEKREKRKRIRKEGRERRKRLARER